MKKVDFDEYAREYNDLLREGTGFFTEDETYFARYKVGIAARKMGRAPARILEFGCGIGRNIPYLRAAFPGAEVMGSDVSARSLDLAREANPDVHFWREGDGQGERGDFDLVFVAGVFHHIPPAERDTAAELVARRLRPAGRVIVFEHNPFNPVTRRIVRDCPYDEGVKLLRRREMAGLLRDAGLAPFGQGYTLFFPPRLKALAGLEPSLAWCPLGGQYWVGAEKA